MIGDIEPALEPSIGRYLARQRSMRGISVEELATLTRIPRRSLERLEAGAFDLSPDGFTRGFVRTVAEALGLDPDETVMRMLHEPCGEPLARARAARIPALLLVAIAGGLLAAAAGWGLWRLGAALGSEAGSPRETELVYRRDAVRALAAEQASRQPAAREDEAEPSGEPTPADPDPGA